jgi:hypothetical protein
MHSRAFLKLRMISDFVLACAFGFVAPTILAPIGRSQSILLTGFAILLCAVWFLFDGLRTLQRLLKSSPDPSAAAR